MLLKRGENKLINAKEAREKVEQGKYEKAIEQMNQIEKEIEIAINKGFSSVSLNGVLESPNRRQLEELGYAVNTGSQYNESYYSITW